MTKFKLIYIDPMSYNNLGLYDLNLLLNIQDQSEIYFICSNKFEYKNKISKVHIIDHYNYHNKPIIIKVLSYIISYFKTLIKVFLVRPDIVHIQWIKIPSLEIFGYKLIKLLNKKIFLIYTAHNIIPHDIKKVNINLYKKMYSIFDSIIVHSETTKLTLKNEFYISTKKISVINHGIFDLSQTITDISKFNFIFNSYNIKYKSNNEIIFSILGSLSYYKGVDLIVEAWKTSKLLFLNKNVKLIIAGKPTYKFEILDNTNIYYDLNFLSNEEYYAYLKITDILLLPYRQISQSGVLAAALFENVPVIVSNSGGLRDPFKLGNIGWIINDLNVSSVRETLEEVFLNINKVTFDWSRINKEYSWEKIAKETLNVYKNLKNLQI